MLNVLVTYYAQNYTGIIGWSLSSTCDVRCFHHVLISTTRFATYKWTYTFFKAVKSTIAAASLCIHYC